MELICIPILYWGTFWDLFHQQMVRQPRGRRGAPRLNEVFQVAVVGGKVDLKITTQASQLQWELL